jgi:uncharacterized protein YgiM (DUF1202 family)
VASKGAGVLVWLALGVVGLAWCAPRDSVRQQPSRQPTSQIAQPYPARQPSILKQSTRDASPLPMLQPQTPSVPSETMYAAARLNVRTEPTTSGRVLGRIETGAAVRSLGRQGAWHRVSYGGQIAWVHGNYLSVTPPAKPSPSQHPYAAAQAPAPRLFSNKPVREPYTGICDCPYDYKRNGARCGGTSAYSRRGGRDPECYE